MLTCESIENNQSVTDSSRLEMDDFPLGSHVGQATRDYVEKI